MEIKPEVISRFKKEAYLLKLSEDEFRDKVVRPLFLRLKLNDGRDFCGPTEKGKDVIFIQETAWNVDEIIAIQTKKGSLNLSKKQSTNIVEAITQLRTALETRIYFILTKEKKLPAKVFLCVSGKMNEASRIHIATEIKDTRLLFMDADDIIPLIDLHIPELWLGIDAELMPYLRNIKNSIENNSNLFSNSDILSGSALSDSATDDMFISLRLHRTVLKLKKQSGRMMHVPKFEEIPIVGLLSRKENLFLIQGDAGAGKSTALRRIMYVLAKKGIEGNKKFVVPVLLRANNEKLKDNRYSLVQISMEETKRITNSNNPSISNDNINNGDVIILIDALDELSCDEYRETVMNKVLDFNKNYPNCKIIITSRKISFLNTNETMKKILSYSISPINFTDIDRILKRFEKKHALTKESAKEVMRRLQQIHGMELNPLLVTIFAATSDYNRKDIPANITELFKKFTEMMLGRWDEAKKLEHQYHAPLKDFLLCKIAFEMHRRKHTSILIKEFREFIEKELISRGHKGNVDQLTDEILNRSNLFRFQGDKIEFRHFLLQEFFAGRGIPSKDYLKSIVYDLWWQRAIVFYFGQNPEESTGLLEIMEYSDISTGKDIFTASLTIGLALQAAYLVKIDVKSKLIGKVIRGISICKDEVVIKIGKSDHPLMNFIAYYLIGRDSVACNFLAEQANDIISNFDDLKPSQEEYEVFMFWFIIGLIESGALDVAEKYVKLFKPSDTRFLLAIHLGCFLTHNLRITSKEAKKNAENIMRRLEERIKNLREEFIEEYKSELLELKMGEIVAIENNQVK